MNSILLSNNIKFRCKRNNVVTGPPSCSVVWLYALYTLDMRVPQLSVNHWTCYVTGWLQIRAWVRDKWHVCVASQSLVASLAQHFSLLPLSQMGGRCMAMTPYAKFTFVLCISEFVKFGTCVIFKYIFSIVAGRFLKYLLESCGYSKVTYFGGFWEIEEFHSGFII